MRASLMQAFMLPRAPPDVRENNNNPTQMWGRRPLCFIRRPPQHSVHPPWLMHAIFFALTWQEGDCVPAFAVQTTTQMPKYSCRCIHALVANMPTFSGQAHGSTYNYDAEKRKDCILVCSSWGEKEGEAHNSAEYCLMMSDMQPFMVVIEALEAARLKDRWCSTVFQGIMNIERFCRPRSSSKANVQHQCRT